jgi:hypothetical protein
MVVGRLTAQNSAPPQKLTQAENIKEAVQPVNTGLVFARMKQLAGRWGTQSTKGWSGGDLIRVICRGSAVLVESEFDDNAEAGMATLYYLDKGRLLLTHYCEAKNQPTLVATGQSADGKVVLFTFLSGTGMTSRDEGHMDKVVFRFIDEDSYTSQWTWYSAGSEKWLEEIENRRLPRDAQPNRKP